MDGSAEFTLKTYPENLNELVDLGIGDPRFNGMTALHGSVISNQPSIMQYLSEHGAKLNAKNQLGWTPLMMTKGIFMANAYKEFPLEAKILQEALAKQGLPIE